MIFNDFGEIPGILVDSRNLQTIFRDFQLFRKVSNEFQRFEAPDVLARLPTCWQGHMHWTRPRDASLLKPTPWTTAHLIDLMWPTPLHRWRIPSIPNHSNFSSGHFVIISGPEILPHITILKLIVENWFLVCFVFGKDSQNSTGVSYSVTLLK